VHHQFLLEGGRALLFLLGPALQQLLFLLCGPVDLVRGIFLFLFRTVLLHVYFKYGLLSRFLDDFCNDLFVDGLWLQEGIGLGRWVFQGTETTVGGL